MANRLRGAIVEFLYALWILLGVLIDSLNDWWELPVRRKREVFFWEVDDGGPLESFPFDEDEDDGPSSSSAAESSRSQSGDPAVVTGNVPVPDKPERPPDRQSRLQGKGKYYAVVVGHEPGVYDSWADTHRQVNRFKGNCFKGGFRSYRAAEEFRTRMVINLSRV